MSEEFELKLNEFEKACEAKALNVKCYCLIRTPRDQAKLWRQSRTSKEVNETILWLEAEGADYLAAVLKEVGPQPMAPRVTNCLPGFSWHQWGEAADYCPLDKQGKLDWNDDRGFHLMAEEARKVGLESGHFWVMRDKPHIQYCKGLVVEIYSYREIDNAMRSRYGEHIETRH